MSETTAGKRAGSGGLFAGATNGATALLATGRTRLELLGNELKEEKLRAVRLLLLSQMLAFCAALGTVLLVALLVVVYWENRAIVLAWSLVLDSLVFDAEAEIRWLDHCEARLRRAAAEGTLVSPRRPAEAERHSTPPSTDEEVAR